jgi:hypothetical protein
MLRVAASRSPLLGACRQVTGRIRAARPADQDAQGRGARRRRDGAGGLRSAHCRGSRGGSADHDRGRLPGGWMPRTPPWGTCWPGRWSMTRRTEPGSDGWRAQFWLAWTAPDSVDLPARLQRCAAVIDVIGDRQPSPMLVDCLALQATILSDLGRIPEAVLRGRRALLWRASWLPVRPGPGHHEPGQSRPVCRRPGRWLAAGPGRPEQIPDIPGTAARTCSSLLADHNDRLAAALVAAAAAVFLDRAGQPPHRVRYRMRLSPSSYTSRAWTVSSPGAVSTG